MPTAEALCAFAIDQFHGNLPLQLTGLIRDHRTDHSRTLLATLEECNRKAWRALEIALAGESLWTRFDRAETKAIRTAIKEFVDTVEFPGLEGKTREYRARCLRELREALGKGVLLGSLVAGDLADKAGRFAGELDPQAVLKAEKTALKKLAQEIQGAGFQALGWLVHNDGDPDRSVVVVAVRYFFRRAVETNAELFRGLQFTAVEALAAGQDALAVNQQRVLEEQQDGLRKLHGGFAQLEECLTRWESELEKGLAEVADQIRAEFAALRGQVGDVHDGVKAVADSVKGVHDSVQGVHDRVQEIRGTVEQATAAAVAAQDSVEAHAADTARRLDDLQARMAQLLDKLEMRNKPVEPRHSLSVRTDRERDLVKDLLRQIRALPEEARSARPELVTDVGKLQIAVGDFFGAGESFVAAAVLATSDAGRAEAHHNAYRAKLEQDDHTGALDELLKAVRLNARLAPFPFDKYRPERILGAGGFGVTFLCRHRLTEAEVAVKAIDDGDLERDAGSVMAEAMALDKMKHRAIIGLRDCGYGDETGRRRPYLVMEYFDGPTILTYVEQNGPIPLADLLPVAKTLSDALTASHRQGVLHRDIKPANVMVKPVAGGSGGTGGPAQWEVRLIDFGLAMRADVLTASLSTSRGSTMRGMSVAGTLDYAAPEQLGKLPGAKVGPPADVYGFAKTLCFALFGTTEPTNRHYKMVPEPMADLIGRCLSRSPADRPQDFGEVLDALNGVYVPEAARDPTARPAGESAPPRAGAPKKAGGALPEAHQLSAGSKPVPLPRARPVRARPVDDMDYQPGLGPPEIEPAEDESRSRPRDPSRQVGHSSSPSEGSNDRVTHALVAILLGGFGIHKYMQGNSGNGTLRLVLGFFTVWLVTVPIGIIEGIQYLGMSDEQYARTYLRRKKDWF
ncbi:MAG: hypothetical protein JWO38_257 [Gemmataceae bacterium]|nr:hypothetical protein [Gemmataceae bacterium]